MSKNPKAYSNQECNNKTAVGFQFTMIAESIFKTKITVLHEQVRKVTRYNLYSKMVNTF